MKQLIVIPTYNERTNISLLLKKLIRLYKSRFEILIIDDNSPDGTAIESVSGPDPIDKHPLKKRSRLNTPNNFHNFLKTKSPILLTNPTPI